VATAEGNAVAVRGVRISLDHRLYYKICKEALDDIMESDFPSEIRKADFGKSEDLPAESRKPYFGASDKRISRKQTRLAKSDNRISNLAAKITFIGVLAQMGF